MREIDQKLFEAICSVSPAVEAVSQCLAEGADPNARDGGGYSPLMTCALQPRPRLDDQYEIMGLLIDAGGSVESVSQHERTTAIDMVRNRIKTLEQNHGASFYRPETANEERAQEYLFANMNSLRRALRVLQRPMARKALMETDAGLGLCDDEGRTVMHLAAAEGNLARLQEGLDSYADLHAKDNEGYTPAMEAAAAGQAQALELLLPLDDQWAKSQTRTGNRIGLLAVRGGSREALGAILKEARKPGRYFVDFFAIEANSSPLKEAVHRNEPKMIKHMLDLVQHVRHVRHVREEQPVRNIGLYKALWEAAHSGRDEIVGIIFEHSASEYLDGLIHDRSDALIKAAVNSKSLSTVQVLHKHLQRYDSECRTKILLEAERVMDHYAQFPRAGTSKDMAAMEEIKDQMGQDREAARAAAQPAAEVSPSP